MAPAILSSEAIKPNIPAWKRLGLKLKSAQQESVPYAAPVVVAPVATEPKKEKRKREIKDQKAPLGKRVKLSKSAQVHEPTTDTTPSQSPITSGHQRRKSVTFTPETKTEDGDSIKQLYNGWIAKHPTQGPKFHELRSRSASKIPHPAQAAEQIDSAIDEVLQEVEAAQKPKKQKRPKKAKSPKSQKVVKPTKQLDPALSYLKLFHESKDTWKFNKIHQINLLKNAFDVEKIPSEYIEIFYTYVAGLKGSARTQLRDAAIAIKVKAQEESAMESAGDTDSITPGRELEGQFENDVAIVAPDSASEIGYEERVLQPLSDLTIKQRMAKRMRAERILDELAQEAQEPGEEVNGSSESVKDEEGDRESQKRLKMSDGSTQRLRRKRKQRTNAVEDSSSSDSTDSDSSSEDDDDEGIPEPTEEESSSSSSSSSSTSEGDEDSESSESESGSNESE
jgi:hypothetical protein